MLLLVALTLKGRITISQPTPVPIPIPKPPDGGSKIKYSNVYDEIEKRQREQILRIEIENSEIIAIVELTLRNFII